MYYQIGCRKQAANGLQMRINKYLYSAEAAGTILAIVFYPVVTQTLLDSETQSIAAVSALQELLPLLTASGVVLPQSVYPL